MPTGSAVERMIDELMHEYLDNEKQLTNYQPLLDKRERLKSAILSLERLLPTKGKEPVYTFRIKSPDEDTTKAEGADQEAASVSEVVRREAIARGMPRSASMPDLVREVLAEAKKPLHVGEIITRLKQKGYYPNRQFEDYRIAIVPGVMRKVHERKVFTKVAPQTFGLIEWQEQGGEHKNGKENPQVVLGVG